MADISGTEPDSIEIKRLILKCCALGATVDKEVCPSGVEKWQR